MNNWNITGNLGNDAEVSTTNTGKYICSFSVAVKSGYGQNEKTTWVKCVIFGARAEGKLPEMLKKGKQVAISGEIYLDEWEDKQGQKQKTLKMVVGSLDLIGGVCNSEIGNAKKASNAPTDSFDSEIPF